MKKFLAVVVLAVVLSMVTSCLVKETCDVVISHTEKLSDFSGDDSDLEQYLAESKKVRDAFDNAFNASGLEVMAGRLVLRNQTNNQKAISEAKAIGDKANASLSGFTARWRITVEITVSSSFGEEVVAKYQY